jgi:hypothetical protein
MQADEEQEMEATQSYFRLSSSAGDAPFCDTLGDCVKVQLGPGAPVAEITGMARGRDNVITVAAGVRIARVQLDIDGDLNRITIDEGSRIEDCQLCIRGNTEHGNFRGENNLVHLGSRTELLRSRIEIKGSWNSVET